MIKNIKARAMESIEATEFLEGTVREAVWAIVNGKLKSKRP